MLQSAKPLRPQDPVGPLRVIIIGRISTIQQQETSIDASYRYVEDYLKQIYDGPIEIKHLGERASGMIVDRATIREAEDLIAEGRCDLVIAEDLSRIFRNPRHQYNFVQDSVDAGTRVICIADNLDTADDHWEAMMSAATLRHGLTVPDARRRVRRTATHAFHRGGMVQRVRFGYRKLTAQEAASGDHGPVGLAIAKRPECTAVIRSMGERLVRGEAYAGIAGWLNDEAVETPPYAANGQWSARLVKDLLRDPILAGTRTFRRTLFEPIFRTGRHRRLKNEQPETEHYAELAHLSAEEHQCILHEMTNREQCKRRRSGHDHPLYRQPRTRAIWPAQHARCAICGGMFYRYDRGSLKCRNALLQGQRSCWSHVQVRCSMARKKVLSWLVQLTDQDAALRASLLAAVRAEPDRVQARARRAREALAREIEQLEQQEMRLADAIARGGQIDVLLERLQSTGRALSAARTRYAGEADRQEETAPDKHSAPVKLEAELIRLAGTSYEFADLIRRLFPRFTIQPVQALDTGQVRPRAKLLFDARALLAGDNGKVSASPDPVNVSLDLFEPPQHVRHIDACRRLRQERPGLGLKQLGRQLGINHMTAKRALDYDRLMKQQGLTDPYPELQSEPASASRWRQRRRRR